MADRFHGRHPLDPNTHAARLMAAQAIRDDHDAFNPPRIERGGGWLNIACWIALVVFAALGAWAVGNPVGWLL